MVLDPPAPTVSSMSSSGSAATISNSEDSSVASDFTSDTHEAGGDGDAAMGSDTHHRKRKADNKKHEENSKTSRFRIPYLGDPFGLS